MGFIDYKKLYELQDKVLEKVFSAEKIFYLTGGTCLSRFYKEKRYSDDLDFFTNDNDNFTRVIREIKEILRNNFEVKEEVSSKDFIRLKINDFLQVDFINDRVMRYKEPIYLDNGYMIDTWENILANKLTAIIGRDNAKDVFDVFLIASFYEVKWSHILEIAHKKAAFSNDDLIIRLKTFPTSLLKNILLLDKVFLDNFENNYQSLVKKIEDAMEKEQNF